MPASGANLFTFTLRCLRIFEIRISWHSNTRRIHDLYTRTIILEEAYKDLQQAIVPFEGVERDLVASLFRSALRYADLRSRWFLASQEERKAMDANRTTAHNAFIDTCNAVSRLCAREARSTKWRAQFGDARSGEPRKLIGDFACYIAYRCMIEAR